jgi:hypothetical protein
VQARLAELKAEYLVGEEKLRELLGQEAAVRETLLRISGAVQVLEEVLDGSDGAGPDGDQGEGGPGDGAQSDERPGVLTVP